MTDRTINPGQTRQTPRKPSEPGMAQDHPLFNLEAAMDNYVKLAHRFEATSNVANAQQSYLTRMFAELGTLYQEALNELAEMEARLEGMTFGVEESEIRHGEKLVLRQGEQLPLPIPADAITDVGNEDIGEDIYEGMPDAMRHSDSARRGWKAGAKAAGKVFPTGKSEGV